jgi:cobyrinic acid a,c-diamide synthase
MGALSATGLTVQGFKVGPDFIDPTYHTAVTNRKSRNLDAWLLSQKRVLELFHQNTTGCDIAVVEGVMGLYDGLNGTEVRGSTAHLAKLLKSPVILVLDISGMARSAAAVVAGCKVLDKRLTISGVVLNRVAGEKHVKMCKDTIESITAVPVVGALPKNSDILLPERHLGLVPTNEKSEVAQRLKNISEFVRANVDVDRIIEIAKTAPSLPVVPFKRINRNQRVRIGVAYDEAFNFYYQDALDTLTEMGAELEHFSPIHDKHVPEDFDGLYIGGGFPEVLGKGLEANHSMRSSVKKKAEEGMPIFAECGGLMYLTRSITDFDGLRHSMVGVLDCETLMTKLTLNYTDAVVIRDNILAKSGNSIKGHEFHFSKLDGVPSDIQFAYEMRRGVGIDRKKDGWTQYSILAQYMHTHLAASPKYASNFIKACLDSSKK